jgi:hypothetical protein
VHVPWTRSRSDWVQGLRALQCPTELSKIASTSSAPIYEYKVLCGTTLTVCMFRRRSSVPICAGACTICEVVTSQVVERPHFRGEPPRHKPPPREGERHEPHPPRPTLCRSERLRSTASPHRRRCDDCTLPVLPGSLCSHPPRHSTVYGEDDGRKRGWCWPSHPLVERVAAPPLRRRPRRQSGRPSPLKRRGTSVGKPRSAPRRVGSPVPSC